MYSLNKIVRIQSDFADSHNQINDFVFDQAYSREAKPNLKYPLLWSDLESSRLSEVNDSGILGEEFVFNIAVVDLVNSDQSNELEVLSDCKLILNDFLFYLRQTNFNEYLTVDMNVSMEPIRMSGADVSSGWACKVTFKIATDPDLCGIPKSNSPTYINPLQVTIYDQDNNVVTRLNPGQTYNVIIASGIDEGGSTATYSIQIVDI